jgi:hypothetical protein
MNTAEYSLLLINPAIERLDTVVVGAIFKTEAGWDVRVASTSAKMQAINPSFPSSKLIQTAALAKEMVSGRPSFEAVRSGFEGTRLGLIVDQFVGAFTFDSPEEYQRQVSLVLSESVNPPSLSQSNAAPVSRRRNLVRRNLRAHFKAKGLWSRKEEDIQKHKVVEQFSIDQDSGIVAEFALRNGVMHITETIDFEMQSLAGKRLLAQAKTLVLSESTRVFGQDTMRYVVAAGSSREDARQSMHLLADHATEIFALESSADMDRYVALIAAAAGAAQASVP